MKVLLCHNYYLEAGGEDAVFADEADLLESHGHAIVRFTMHNRLIEQMTRWQAARKTIWNAQVYRCLRDAIRRERPDIMHCTNTFPLISPAAYYAARAEGVPVVQSLHNYRLLCANGSLFREGEGSGGCPARCSPWRCLRRGCYRGSRAATAVVLGMVRWHRLIGTWSRAVDMYVALTECGRREFIDWGLPAGRIAVKPNFVSRDPGPGDGRGRYAVFVGRLSPEKGIDTLLDAWNLLDGRLPLKIIGDGPRAEQVKMAAQRDPNIQWLGRCGVEEVMSVVGGAQCLVFPSVCQESFGRTIIEAFAKGTPVVASKRGVVAELVADGVTGLHFESGNPKDLASKVGLLAADRPKQAEMRAAARREFEHKYTAQANYSQLMDIYQRAFRIAGRQPPCVVPVGQRVITPSDTLIEVEGHK